jgi:anti-sigma B factor antagonist
LNGNVLVLGSHGAKGIMSGREERPSRAPLKEGNVQVQLDVTDGHTICRPVGALDAYSAPGARKCMALLSSVPKLIVDLSEVPFIDSAGLRALLASIRRVRDSGGQVAVCSAQPQVRGLLDAVALGTVVCIAGTVEEACRMLIRQPPSNSIGKHDSSADRSHIRNHSVLMGTVGARSAYGEGVR